MPFLSAVSRDVRQLCRLLSARCGYGAGKGLNSELIAHGIAFHQDDKDSHAWHDVEGPHGRLLIFENETEGRARLEQPFSILVKMAHYAAGLKHARVVSMYAQDEA